MSWNFVRFSNFNFKLNLKVSAFYLEKQKSLISKKKYCLSSTAKTHPKVGVSRLNFPEGFGFNCDKYFDLMWFWNKIASWPFLRSRYMIWLGCPYLNLKASADKGASSAYDSEYEQRFLVTGTRLRVLNLLLRL